MPFDGTPAFKVVAGQLAVLDMATSLIKNKRNWCQGTTRKVTRRFMRKPQVSYCLWGALALAGAAAARGRTLRYGPAAHAVDMAVKECGEQNIWEYNDAVGRTHDDVMRVMRRAREILSTRMVGGKRDDNEFMALCLKMLW